jgi:hypothetical protein
MAAAIVFGLMAWGAMEPPASGWLAAGRPMLTLAAADTMASAAIAEAVAKGAAAPRAPGERSPRTAPRGPSDARAGATA